MYVSLLNLILNYEIQLKYKCICICILSYYTYSGTEYMDDFYVEYLSANSVYLIIYTICITPGGTLSTP